MTLRADLHEKFDPHVRMRLAHTNKKSTCVLRADSCTRCVLQISKVSLFPIGEPPVDMLPNGASFKLDTPIFDAHSIEDLAALIKDRNDPKASALINCNAAKWKTWRQARGPLGWFSHNEATEYLGRPTTYTGVGDGNHRFKFILDCLTFEAVLECVFEPPQNCYELAAKAQAINAKHACRKHGNDLEVRMARASCFSSTVLRSSCRCLRLDLTSRSSPCACVLS